MSDKVLLTLTIEVDETAAEFAQEWANGYADNARDGLTSMGFQGEVILSSSDGIFEYH